MVLQLVGIALLLGGPCVLAGDPLVIRGIPRSQESSYLALKGKSQFQCRGSKTVIPFSQVNDNFCDCEDGSDEPGTAACAQGRFYCRNKGHQGLYLPSSRVDDGICDCCDGSDEASGACPNTCQAASAEFRAARAAQLKALELGAAKKKTYIETSAKAAEERLEELAVAQKDVEGRRKGLEDAKARKEKVEAEEKGREDAVVKDKLAALRKALGVEPGATEDRLKEVYEKIKHRHGRVLNNLKDEIQAVISPPPPKEAEEKKEGEEGPVPPSEEGEDQDYEHYGEEGLSDAEAEGKDKEGGDGAGDTGLDEQATKALEEAEEGTRVKTEEGDALREEVSKLEGEVRDLERRIEDLENTNNSNFGPQGELFALKGRCFTRTVNQYVYEMCPYGDAKQKEGHSSVNLGRWDRAESTDNGGFKFFFRNGQRCWNGPERSLTVTVTCGHEEEVLSVDEPAVCEYVMDFVTPAACDATYAQQLKLDLEDEESSARSEL